MRVQSCHDTDGQPHHPSGVQNINNKLVRGRKSCTIFFSILRQQLDVYSLSLGGREASLLHCKPAQKSRPKPIEETPFICPSDSQLHLMSFPPLLAGAYISSILIARGGRHRGT